jgi:hypothetical protein
MSDMGIKIVATEAGLENNAQSRTFFEKEPTQQQPSR